MAVTADRVTPFGVDPEKWSSVLVPVPEMQTTVKPVNASAALRTMTSGLTLAGSPEVWLHPAHLEKCPSSSSRHLALLAGGLSSSSGLGEVAFAARQLAEVAAHRLAEPKKAEHAPRILCNLEDGMLQASSLSQVAEMRPIPLQGATLVVASATLKDLSVLHVLALVPSAAVRARREITTQPRANTSPILSHLRGFLPTIRIHRKSTMVQTISFKRGTSWGSSSSGEQKVNVTAVADVAWLLICQPDSLQVTLAALSEAGVLRNDLLDTLCPMEQ
ncbi:unnamed protein product, partial [Polarella glacialis]